MQTVRQRDPCFHRSLIIEYFNTLSLSLSLFISLSPSPTSPPHLPPVRFISCDLQADETLPSAAPQDAIPEIPLLEGELAQEHAELREILPQAHEHSEVKHSCDFFNFTCWIHVFFIAC